MRREEGQKLLQETKRKRGEWKRDKERERRVRKDITSGGEEDRLKREEMIAKSREWTKKFKEKKVRKREQRDKKK